MPLPNFNRRSPQPQLLTNSFDGWRCNVSPCVAACGGYIVGMSEGPKGFSQTPQSGFFCKLGDRKACETATLFLIKPLRSCAPPPHPRSARQRKTLLHRDTRNNKSQETMSSILNLQPLPANVACFQLRSSLNHKPSTIDRSQSVFPPFASRMVLHHFPPKETAIHMHIDFCRCYVFMPEHLLDGTQIGAAFEQMGSKGMAQGMRTDTFPDAALPAQILHNVEHHHTRHFSASPVQEKDVFASTLWRQCASTFQIG